MRLLCLVLAACSLLSARVEENVVYGMRGGLALLMDVHVPERSNGRAIVCIPGSGWHAPFGYDARPLKASGFVRLTAPLVDAGYTVFAVNHRAAPRHVYPAAVEDAQRAVRFVRAHADRWGVDPDQIGGIGSSSGGHLVSMLGVLDGGGDAGASDKVERVSAKLQAVFARAAPTDLTQFEGLTATASLGSFLGMRLHQRDEPDTEEYRRYWQASPAAHVSPDDPPFLLLHGTADRRVPYARSPEFVARLRADGVQAELITVSGAGHGPAIPNDRMVEFFNSNLQPRERTDPPASPASEPGVERDVVFGMVSGGALLMDVYRPERPNGYGVIHITGSGWHSPMAADAPQQKASRQVEVFGLPLVKAGYTLFAVNHRTAPRYKHPAQIEDVERAVRFIRHHAKGYGIDGERIGGVGGSSGGHLTLLLGLRSGPGDPQDPDPVNRESARLQAIVPWAPPSDLPKHNGEFGAGTFASWFGMRLMERDPHGSLPYRTYWEASPLKHVSSDDPPTLIIHGDADASVPIEHSEALAERMREAGVEVELLAIPGGGHGASFPGKASDAPDYVQATVTWFDRWLKR